ncbi:MAG: hypothetical protein EBZ14_05840, partial [Gammaproteobacteria bacterium]|nr:hypothetical protein [Gammaproteobacteria bacterium]
SYKRVSDYRLGQIEKLPNVSFFPGSRMDADSVREFGADQVLIATGAHWRADGLGRYTETGVAGITSHPNILTPDQLMAGNLPREGAVVVYDDDHYYMGGVIAGWLSDRGLSVTLVTPGPEVSCWTKNTMEQHRIEKTLLDKGVCLIEKHTLTNVSHETLSFAHNTTSQLTELQAQSLVMVTLRQPVSDLYFELAGHEEQHLETLPFRLTRVGDCMAPSTIAAAVYDGHRIARELDSPPHPDSVPYKRERPLIDRP